MNYYFVKTDRGEVIQEWESQVDCFKFTDYTELTIEQMDFYITNPSASILEIKNCVLNVIEIKLDDYKYKKIQELSDLSIQTSYSLMTTEQRENLDCGLPNLTYTQAQRVQLNYDCRVEFYRVKSLIEDAITLEEVDIAFDSNIYNKITLRDAE